ncbi:unnamed protein product [Adineta ricciae]|uniref:Uncharacterized protein n=1 Tax=Adineta ricciae TaxID=249248 RepID=A0A814YCU7_ADIRI|nr:unnamed protein product [Adineta ricciae]
MFADGLYLSLISTIVLHQTATHALRVLPTEAAIGLPATTISTSESTKHENITARVDSIKLRIDQSKNIIHNTFSQIDRGTFIRATIVLAGITALILMYVGLKAFLLRKKRQPKRYTLITDPTAIEAPLFDANDDEDEIEDDTLFVRK